MTSDKDHIDTLGLCVGRGGLLALRCKHPLRAMYRRRTAGEDLRFIACTGFSLRRGKLHPLATWRVLPEQKSAVKYLTGHTQWVTCLAASSYTIASGAADETVRLWDRKTGACRHILQLPCRPSALHLLSDDLTVVTCWRSCSVWKGSRCLRTICPNLSVPPQTTNSSRIRASAVSDNLLFLGVDGASAIQVWDLYSGLEVQGFRPVLSVGSIEDHRITALAAGTVHGYQILLAGIRNAALEPKVLVLHPNDGEAAASPIPFARGKGLYVRMVLL